MTQDVIKAVVVDPAAVGRLSIAEVAAPQPGPHEALVRVEAISLNRGEVKTALSDAAPGARPGWDFAGTVLRAAESGGPAAGARVVGVMATGSWAQQVAAMPFMMAELPPGISIPQAAALPVAGLTAWASLRRRPELKGRRVLITGATGGVGVFAIQLAAHWGAEVTAVIRSPEREALVRKLGAAAVAYGPMLEGAVGNYDLILESVGGQTLGSALGRLNPGGEVVLFGASDSPVTTFDASAFRAGGTSLYGLFLGYEFQHSPPGPALAELAGLVAAGTLDPMIEIEAPWERIAEVAADLVARRYTGKAVLTVQ
ncbi:zinc-binding dehydrogenase [Caulobacter sp. KR2-114]|uniref:zinc-binding dehydrogenase n=1 Tax=Caulobacter sp. KR2-114 TaxID=3400912 RepID=UPI003BFF8E54